MQELTNIAFGPIPPPKPEPSLLHSIEDSLDALKYIIVYIDDGLTGHSRDDNH